MEKEKVKDYYTIELLETIKPNEPGDDIVVKCDSDVDLNEGWYTCFLPGKFLESNNHRAYVIIKKKNIGEKKFIITMSPINKHGTYENASQVIKAIPKGIILTISDII